LVDDAKIRIRSFNENPGGFCTAAFDPENSLAGLHG
jgi:hypothetical protein